jgi:periplasmic protein TonB
MRKPRFIAGRAIVLGLFVVCMTVICSAQVIPTPMPGQRVRVSSGVAKANLKKSVPPVYPQAAKDAGITGQVVMGVLIDEKGNVQDVHVVAGHPELAQAAEVAVKQWKYKPYVLNGQPIPVETQVTVNFNLVRR